MPYGGTGPLLSLETRGSPSAGSERPAGMSESRAVRCTRAHRPALALVLLGLGLGLTR